MVRGLGDGEKVTSFEELSVVREEHKIFLA